MEKTKEVVQELKLLKAHYKQAIIAVETIENKASKVGDQLLSETLSTIRQRSEQTFTDIENALENYHLKINLLDKST